MLRLPPRATAPRAALVATRGFAARPPPPTPSHEPPQPPRPNSQPPPQHAFGQPASAPFEPHNQPVGGPGAQIPSNPNTRSRPFMMVGLLTLAFGVAYFIPWERSVKKQAKEMVPVVRENRAPTADDKR